MNRPQPNDYPEWMKGYVSLVEGADILALLENQGATFPAYLNTLTEKADYAYAPGKWTIKEMTGHIIDTERVMAYRMMCFARGEQHALPGFEEDDYVKNASFSSRSLLSLSEEFAAVRKANLYLFKSLNDTELKRSGIASDRNITVNALLFVIAGHLAHHINIIKERYL